MTTEAQLLEGLRAADDAGNTADAQAFADQIKSLRGGGQPTPVTVPLGDVAGPSAEVPLEQDAFPNTPRKIGTYELPDEMRQRFIDIRKIADPKKRHIEAAKLAGTISARSEDGNLADKFAKSGAGAGLRGLGVGILGLGDLAATAATAVTTDMTWGEALAAQRAFRHELEREHTAMSLIGEVGGAILTGSAALQGARALTAGTKLAPLVAKATVFTKGGGAKGLAKNIARATGAGALAGGITEGVSEGKPVEGAVIGALSGPLSVGLLKAANISAVAIKRIGDDPAAAGLRAMAKKIGVSADEMSKRFLRHKAATGQTPTMAEIMDEQAVAELNELIAERSSAAAIARQGVKDIEAGRGAAFAEQIGGGRRATSAARHTQVRDEFADARFDKVREQDFEFDVEDIELFLENDDIIGLVGKENRKMVHEAIKDVTDEETGEITGSVSLTGEFVENLRLALGDAADKGQRGFKGDFKTAQQNLAELMGEQSEDAAAALKGFAQRSQRIEGQQLTSGQAGGIRQGRKIITAKTSEFTSEANQITNRDAGAGLVAGTRTALTDVASEGASAAVRLSKRLSEDGGLVARLRAVFPEEEVDRLIELGKVQAGAADKLAKLAPGARAEVDPIKEMIHDAAAASFATTTGGAGKAGLVTRLTGRFLPKPISKRVAENLASDLLDPKRTSAAIDALRRAGAEDADIMDLFVGAFAGGNLATNE